MVKTALSPTINAAIPTRRLLGIFHSTLRAERLTGSELMIRTPNLDRRDVSDPIAAGGYGPRVVLQSCKQVVERTWPIPVSRHPTDHRPRPRLASRKR